MTIIRGRDKLRANTRNLGANPESIGFWIFIGSSHGAPLAQRAAGRATRTPPVIMLMMPPNSNQMDLLVGEPVKNFEKSDAVEFEL
jgi:hypothetical protein